MKAAEENLQEGCAIDEVTSGRQNGQEVEVLDQGKGFPESKPRADSAKSERRGQKRKGNTSLTNKVRVRQGVCLSIQAAWYFTHQIYMLSLCHL